MGGRDRAHLSDLVYGVLRDLRRLQRWVGNAPTELIAARLSEHPGVGADGLARYALAPPGPPPTELDWAERANLPPWLIPEWQALLPEAEWNAAAAALNQPGTADFRVNRLRADRDAVLQALRNRGIEAQPTPWAPAGIRLPRRLPHTDPLLADGQLEPQDEGSQWLVACLPLGPGERVLDYCAGAGGKSLALAASGAQVSATDADPHRLRRLPARAQRAGADITLLDFPPAADPYDGVLVDAPCSGTGTLRRSPELRLDAPDIATLATLQRQILADAAQRVAAGGWLVYATCSLMQQENEAVVADFAAGHPQFVPMPLRRPGEDPAAQLRLWPHRHGTDGFFAAGFRRAG